MSDTPRVNEIVKVWPSQTAYGEMTDLARELERGHQRYEYLRKLTPSQFQALFVKCLEPGMRFDDEVDRRRLIRAESI